jgi:hypothetical protein
MQPLERHGRSSLALPVQVMIVLVGEIGRQPP